MRWLPTSCLLGCSHMSLYSVGILKSVNGLMMMSGGSNSDGVGSCSDGGWGCRSASWSGGCCCSLCRRGGSDGGRCGVDHSLLSALGSRHQRGRGLCLTGCCSGGRWETTDTVAMPSAEQMAAATAGLDVTAVVAAVGTDDVHDSQVMHPPYPAVQSCGHSK